MPALRGTYILPGKPDLFQYIADLAQIVAVAGNGVEALHLIAEPLPLAIDRHVHLRAANRVVGALEDLAAKAEPLGAGEIGHERREHLAARVVDLGGRAIVGLEMGHERDRFEVFAVHPPRRGAVRHGDHAVVREVRVGHERRLARDPPQEHARHCVREVDVAEGREPGVVQEAEHEAGRGVERADEAAHAVGHTKVRGADVVHELAEDVQSEERVDHELPLGGQAHARLGQKRISLAGDIGQHGLVGAGLFEPCHHVGMGDIVDLKAPDFASVLGTLFLADRCVGLQAAQGEDLGAAGVLEPVERPEPPEDVGVFIDDDVAGVHVLLGPRVGVFLEETKEGCLVVEVERSRAVPKEHDRRPGSG